MTLAEARERSVDLRKVARTGGDPDAKRKAAARAAAAEAARDLVTFEKAAETVHATLLPQWKNKKHADTWINGLRLHAYPKLAGKPIQSIGRDDILKVLEPIWTTRVETARRLRQRLQTTFRWAKGEGHFKGENPIDQIGLGLTHVQKATAHLAAMPWRDVPAFWAQLADCESASSACLQFLILTAARSGEARGATWAEVDLEGATWTVPAHGCNGASPIGCHSPPRRWPSLKRCAGLIRFFASHRQSGARKARARFQTWPSS